jgi:hypothetical protein
MVGAGKKMGHSLLVQCDFKFWCSFLDCSCHFIFILLKKIIIIIIILVLTVEFVHVHVCAGDCPCGIFTGLKQLPHASVHFPWTFNGQGRVESAYLEVQPLYSTL